MKTTLIHAIAALVLIAAVADAHAVRRTLRIDFGDWGDAGVDCPGTGIVRNGVLVEWASFVFTAVDDPLYQTDTYCQVTDPDFFSEASFFYGDEQGMAQLVGPNLDGAVTGVRHSLLRTDRFADPAVGFQWAFYFFPGDIVIVALYGLIDENGDPIPPTGDMITEGSLVYWNADEEGFDGEYFCFREGFYTGFWDGEPVGSDPNDACPDPDVIFRNGFE